MTVAKYLCKIYKRDTSVEPNIIEAVSPVLERNHALNVANRWNEETAKQALLKGQPKVYISYFVRAVAKLDS